MLDFTTTDAARVLSYPAQRVLVLGDTLAALRAASDAVDSLGAGPAVALPLADGLERLGGHVTWSAVMLELSADAGDVVDALLDRLEAEARGGRPSVITVPLRLVDRVAARTAHASIAILCDPDPIERSAALSLALARTNPRLRDMTADLDMAKLRQLSEEVARIARVLAALSSEGTARPGLRGAPPVESAAPGGGGDAAELEPATVRAIIRARRLREQYFDADLFADPAWDILLDLIAARLERTPVAVSSLCIAAAVPPTTALRWIKTLTEAGLLVRAADARDGRRVFIELSEAAAAGMIAYLQAAQRLGMLLA